MDFSTNDMIVHQTVNATSSVKETVAYERPILWTPAFILFFVALFILGTSAASLVTYIWINSQLYSVDRVGMAYSLVLLGVWLILSVLARSGWIRLGAVFGGIWAIGMFGHFWLNIHASGSQTVVMTQTLSNSALLASALCLSTGRMQLRRWDTILLWLLPLLFCGYLAYSYIKAPVDMRSLLFIEGKIASITVYLTIVVWWLRIGCWRDQTGPTFLLGLAPIILIALEKMGNINNESSLFIIQLFFLCLMLGAVRLLQGERQLKKATI
jgi:hypothetical protein